MFDNSGHAVDNVDIYAVSYVLLLKNINIFFLALQAFEALSSFTKLLHPSQSTESSNILDTLTVFYT